MSMGLKVGYVLSMFPRLSETFILNEILELERLGIQLAIFMRKSPTAHPVHHEYSQVKAESRLVSVSKPGDWIPTFWDHIRVLFRYPEGWRRTFAFVWKRRRLSLLRKFFIAGRIAQRVRNEGITHLHAHFAADNAKIARFAAMMSGIDYSFTAHAKDIWVKSTPSGLSKLIKMSRFAVTICRYNYDYLAGLTDSPGKVKMIYNGLDLEKFSPITGRDYGRTKEFEILAVGRLVPKKGFFILVDACRILKQSNLDFHCRIVGDGGLHSSLKELILKNNLDDFVDLEGARTQEDLIKNYYSRADVLAVPCLVAEDGDRDGIPTVLLEAMAMEIPVIATPVAGIPEVLVHGETGILVKSGCSLALAEALFSSARNRGDVELLGKSAGRLVRERFDRKQNTGQLARLFSTGEELT